MADVKISELTTATALTGAEAAVIVQDGATKQTTTGAIAAAGYKELTGTLTAGNTSITLSDAAITTASTIDIYTDAYGVSPIAAAVANGSVTMTFNAQNNNITVKVRIS